MGFLESEARTSFFIGIPSNPTLKFSLPWDKFSPPHVIVTTRIDDMMTFLASEIPRDFQTLTLRDWLHLNTTLLTQIR